MSKGGFIFPHTNNKSDFTPAKNVINFLIKKRKQLYEHDPSKWSWVLDAYRTVAFSETKNFIMKKEKNEKRYKLSTHGFRRFFITHVSKNPEEAQKIIKHIDIRTTIGYRDIYNIIETEKKLVNDLASPEFLDEISNPIDQLPTVWDHFKP